MNQIVQTSKSLTHCAEFTVTVIVVRTSIGSSLQSSNPSAKMSSRERMRRRGLANKIPTQTQLDVGEPDSGVTDSKTSCP